MCFFLLLLCWNSFIFSNSFDRILLKIATMPYMEVYYFFWCWDKYRRTLEMGSTSLSSLNEIDHHLSGCWGRQEKRPRNCRKLCTKAVLFAERFPRLCHINFFFFNFPILLSFFLMPSLQCNLINNFRRQFFLCFGCQSGFTYTCAINFLLPFSKKCIILCMT